MKIKDRFACRSGLRAKSVWGVLLGLLGFGLTGPLAQEREERITASPQDSAQARAVADGQSAPEAAREIRLNFRGVPLEMVLDYLSEAAGFIVVLETEVKGRVDVWSNQPLTADEAVALLDRVLHQNGYAAIRKDRMLIIVDRDEARMRDIPVQSGSDPREIPRGDRIITQVVPIRYANAVQLIRDLQPLLPEYARLTANESSNAIVITDTQANIRRMVEIVRALDTTISSISAIRVFPLYYADAKELATVVKELFEPPDNRATGGRGGAQNAREQLMRRFMQGGGAGGAPGGDGGQQLTGQSEARQAASRVVAVADERTNSLVVSAPDEYIPIVEQLVYEIDVQVDDITELRVFQLRHSDPTEIAQILTELFPDETGNQDTRNNQVRFGGGRPPWARGGDASAAAAGQSSDRLRRKGRVIAVADPRTGSVIVSAASELMPQVAEMIAQIDSNPARNQKVFIYDLDHADTENVSEILREMFDPYNTSGLNRTTGNRGQNTANPLQNRQSNLLGNQGQGGARTGTGAGNRTGTGTRNR
jgi:type II secretory pathway component GspD/PulD (secretin)